jgi:arylsulfatase A-like enzyme
MVINDLRLSPEHETLGRALTRGGYRTAYIGKWHLWANELGPHEETRNGFVPRGAYRLGFDDHWEAYNFNHTYYRSPYFENDTTRHIRQQYEPDGQTASAIRFLEENAQAEKPFALFLSWSPPHDPWDEGNVPPEYREMFSGVTLPKRPNYSETSDPYADDWAKLPREYPRLVDAFQRAYYA